MWIIVALFSCISGSWIFGSHPVDLSSEDLMDIGRTRSNIKCAVLSLSRGQEIAGFVARSPRCYAIVKPVLVGSVGNAGAADAVFLVAQGREEGSTPHATGDMAVITITAPVVEISG
jgi:hypothetical protein